MERIYRLLKGKKVKFENFEGVVCGYTEDRFILATEDAPRESFRRFDKGGAFIDEEFKDSKYRYTYCNEIDVYKSNKRLKYI